MPKSPPQETDEIQQHESDSLPFSRHFFATLFTMSSNNQQGQSGHDPNTPTSNPPSSQAQSSPGQPSTSGSGQPSLHVSGAGIMQQQLGQYYLYLTNTQSSAGQSGQSGQGSQGSGGSPSSSQGGQSSGPGPGR
ncbi:hypothetical protein BU26DRAFT_566992 [Trematosphaeria pertusa]|uniref:Uncharacterized protein n=1 Tax=Trematosphaeria pertusa TaxID=390896 RepID=A0A6A6IAT0_9PLEO|nr:uncharacterized protein BU26DRAFT_566992 [Trematosphaeria pertusa]KAF2246640.1 hypothetical protein BU26DRAFT_566992 [Trematosphaeria pertusa]